MIWSSLFTVGYAFITDAYTLLTLFGIGHLAFGVIEVLGNNLIRQMWPNQEATTFLQIMESMFGIGSMMGPVIAAPFITERPDQLFSTTGTINNTPSKPVLQIHWPYMIASGFSIVNAACLLVVWLASPSTPIHSSRLEPEADEQESSSVRVKGNNRWKNVTIILSMIFMHLYMGLDIAFASFLTTFAVHSDLKLTAVTGAHMTTLYWSMFAFFRIITCFYIKYTGPGGNIIISLIIIMIANIILFPFAGTHALMLWIGSAVFGIGMSSIWACIYSYLEEYFVVSPLVTSFIAVSAMSGELVFPSIISSFVIDFPVIVLWITLVCSLLMVLTFSFIFLICKFRMKD